MNQFKREGLDVSFFGLNLVLEDKYLDIFILIRWLKLLILIAFVLLFVFFKINLTHCIVTKQAQIFSNRQVARRHSLSSNSYTLTKVNLIAFLKFILLLVTLLSDGRYLRVWVKLVFAVTVILACHAGLHMALIFIGSI